MKLNLKDKHSIFHVVFWILVLFILTMIFGQSWGSRRDSLYFVSLLLPVVMATSYFFNFFLVPRFLLKKKYFNFFLYFLYTIIVSLYLEMIVLMFSFIYLANFNLGEMGPYARDTVTLGIVLYLVVFMGSFLLMIRQYLQSQKTISTLQDEHQKLKKGFLEVISNRKTAHINYEDILYIESMADYIRIHTIEGNEISSKMKISKLELELPDSFLRIHRSFIINIEKLATFNYDEVNLHGEILLTIGRSYKKVVMEQLKKNE